MNLLRMKVSRRSWPYEPSMTVNYDYVGNIRQKGMLRGPGVDGPVH